MKTLLLDIGGVVLTNAWDTAQRKIAADAFKLDWDQLALRHDLFYPAHEEGKIGLDAYLNSVIFHTERTFSREEFVDFMRSLSQPLEGMIPLFTEVKKTRNVRIVFLSNEGRDLANYRLSHYKLTELGDFFLISSFVGVRKPNPAIYQMAKELTQVPAEDMLYIDDRENLVNAATLLGIPSYRHESFVETKKRLDQFFA
ncbi:HAD-IA family hydrolase [Estrella lausannensis]|uniref:HAD-superfamily hydrolase, subfamily IA, variant 3 n=1 Tax=Estrella lausannensis TaxID=483423 RepID=A0A0H5DPC8_9BACT|nr:HAD-IA family hydrolase [Estrella lausannensis]CRX38267.1 HAD-superfamily hydrolase, subfamily IA, variant 3 [Estrella lausannensis]